MTFRYKQELDPDSIPQFGLIAEEVAKVNPDLVARDEEGKPYAVRYELIPPVTRDEEGRPCFSPGASPPPSDLGTHS